MIEWELLRIKIILVKVTLQIGEKKYLLLILFWKLILRHVKLKIEMEKKIIRNFIKKNCCGVNYKWVSIQN